MQDSYDVIIIGAGPAGLECARSLAGSKLSVLLLDKSKVIGTKVCAGGVKDSESIVDLPENLVKRVKMHYSEFKGRRSATNLTGDEFKCFERVDYGQYMLKQVKKAKNIKVINPILVKKIFKDKIETDKGIYKFRYLVGADGSTSIVRNYLKIKSRHCMGLYYNIRPTTDKLVAYYDPATIKTSYIWEFPHKEYNNVGIYFDLRLLNPQKAKSLLQEYIRSKGYKFEEKEFYGALINYDYQGHDFGNIFLVGDAGGFTSRLHGGGVSNGMLSGREVAKKILDPGYDYRELKLILDKKHKDDRFLDTAEKLPLWLQNSLLWLLLRVVKIPIIGKRINLM